MIARKHFITAYLVLMAAALYLQLHRDLSVPINTPLQQFPSTVGQWRMSGESFLSENVQSVLKASDTLMRQYVNPKGEKVQLYIGYHGGGKGGGEIHSPKHCLPGAGWLEQSSEKARIVTERGELNLVRAVYQKGDQKELFVYWYDVRGESLSDEFMLKGKQIANSFLHRRRDASFVRISVPFQGDRGDAIGVGDNFVQEALPAIRSFLPK